MFYVYHLIDPRTAEVFYIGKGQKNRIIDHEREARAGKRSRKCTRIRDIWQSGLSVERVFVEHFDDETDALIFEATEVDRIGLDVLTNEVPGGGIAGCGPKPLDIDVVKLFHSIMRFSTTLDHEFSIVVHGVDIEIPLCLLRNVKRWMRNILRRRGKDWVLDRMSKFSAA